MEYKRTDYVQKPSPKLKTNKKWYDSNAWETFGKFLFSQFQEFSDKQNSTDENEVKRAFPAFPVKPPSGKYRKEYDESTNEIDENELYDYVEEKTVLPVEKPSFQRRIWRRMGQTIDRQFTALASGAQGLVATAISVGPTVVPAATLTLAGTNFYQNTNQQNVLDEQQDSMDAISAKVAAVEAAVASSTSGASSAAVTSLETKVSYLENQMDAVGTALVNLCGAVERAGASDSYHCCASSENAQFYCARGATLAAAVGIDTGNGVGTCDTSHVSTDRFCKPDGEF